MHALGVVEDEVRELVRRRGLDPEADGGAIRRLIDDVLADYDERTLTSSLPPVSDQAHAARFLYDAIAGLGPLLISVGRITHSAPSLDLSIEVTDADEL